MVTGLSTNWLPGNPDQPWIYAKCPLDNGSVVRTKLSLFATWLTGEKLRNGNDPSSLIHLGYPWVPSSSTFNELIINHQPSTVAGQVGQEVLFEVELNKAGHPQARRG